MMQSPLLNQTNLFVQVLDSTFSTGQLHVLMEPANGPSVLIEPAILPEPPADWWTREDFIARPLERLTREIGERSGGPAQEVDLGNGWSAEKSGESHYLRHGRGTIELRDDGNFLHFAVKAASEKGTAKISAEFPGSSQFFTMEFSGKKSLKRLSEFRGGVPSEWLSADLGRGLDLFIARDPSISLSETSGLYKDLIIDRTFKSDLRNLSLTDKIVISRRSEGRTRSIRIDATQRPAESSNSDLLSNPTFRGLWDYLTSP